LGTIAHRLSGQSTEKIVEDAHGNLPVARMRRCATGDDDDRYPRAGRAGSRLAVYRRDWPLIRTRDVRDYETSSACTKL
jgi:hypothetical protein